MRGAPESGKGATPAPNWGRALPFLMHPNKKFSVCSVPGPHPNGRTLANPEMLFKTWTLCMGPGYRVHTIAGIIVGNPKAWPFEPICRAPHLFIQTGLGGPSPGGYKGAAAKLRP